jgi:Saxitoxin biosynthesis operon protein SxtJ
VGLWPALSGHPVRVWSLVAAGVLLAVAVIAPHILATPNRIWFRLGLLLGKVITPVIMAGLFLLAILPVALVLRLVGKDILRLHPEPASGTYWLPKAAPRPMPESLKDQFWEFSRMTAFVICSLFRGQKKILALADYTCDGFVRWSCRIVARKCRRSLHLHTVLDLTCAS